MQTTQFEVLFGRRIIHLITEFCKNELPQIKTIEEFKEYKSTLTMEQRRHLFNKINLFKHQNYSIHHPTWKDFEVYMTKKVRNSFFLGKRKREEYSYESSDYVLTDFRMILKEYLLKKRIP